MRGDPIQLIGPADPALPGTPSGHLHHPRHASEPPVGRGEIVLVRLTHHWGRRRAIDRAGDHSGANRLGEPGDPRAPGIDVDDGHFQLGGQPLDIQFDTPPGSDVPHGHRENHP